MADSGFEHDSRLVATAVRLRIDAATAEVVRRLDDAGVQIVLLKGPSISSWLYTDAEARGYVDCDLLTRPADRQRAVEVLGTLGFREQYEERGMPTWMRAHASEWWRDADGVLVDLHSTLAGVGVDAATTWSVLSARTDRISVAGQTVPILVRPAILLHIVLHAAQHGTIWGGPLADLERAFTVADESLWRIAADLAEELDAVGPFAAGLRLLPAGCAIAERLGIPAVNSVEAALRATSPPPVALGFEQLARASGARERAMILLRKFIPPAQFMRRWSYGAADSPLRLVRAYIERPIWLLRHAPSGLRAWRRARSEVRRTKRS